MQLLLVSFLLLSFSLVFLFPLSISFANNVSFGLIGMYSRLPISRTFKGNRKKFELSGARSKSGSYCTVNILTVEMLSENWKILLDYKSECNVKNSLNRACVLLFWVVRLFHLRFVTNNISFHKYYMPSYNTSMGNSKSTFGKTVNCFFLPLFKRSKHSSSYRG